MSEQLAFKQTSWNRCAIQFHEGVRTAVTEIMNCTGNQFLSGTRFSINENRRTGWRYRFDLTQYLTQRCAISNDLFEVHLTAQFIFEVELLLCELVLEFRDLTIGQCIVKGDRYLPGDLRQKVNFCLSERILLQASKAKST